MLSAARHALILDHLRSARVASVSELGNKLGVSDSTIRRDLKSLDQAGLLDRVRGGGALRPGTSPVPADQVSFHDVAKRSSDEHERIGAKAASLVKDGQVVVLDIGASVAALARFLRDRPVTVVTASLGVVDQLRDSARCELIVLGGLLRPSYLSLVGPLTEQALRSVRADVSFIGTSGITEDLTVLDSTGAEVPIKQAILKESTRTYLLASQDKFPGSGVYPVCNASSLTGVVTTADRELQTLTDLASTNAEVIFA